MKCLDLVANDNILTGQSTSFVKLAEESNIMPEATTCSLIILYGLGRGTSSCDDLAVAQASLYRMATHIGCTGIFIARYQCLAAECSSHQEIYNRHTHIHVDNGNDPTDFLYELKDGVAGGPFGNALYLHVLHSLKRYRAEYLALTCCFAQRTNHY